MSKAPTYSVEFNDVSGRKIDVVAASRGIWQWHFRCGEKPIPPGGSVELWCEMPKIWLATQIQTETPSKLGYAAVAGSDGLECELVSVQKQWKSLSWAVVSLPEGMASGQELTVSFGSDEHPCTVIIHKYAYAPITWKVDYEGEGVTRSIWPPMVVRVMPGPAAKMTLVLPTVAATGEALRLRGRLEDENSNIRAAHGEPIRLTLVDESGAEVDGCSKSLTVGESGIFELEDWNASTPGVYRVRATTPGLPDAVSNACLVEESPAERIAWGDMHCHTGWADGTGTLEHNIAFARDEAFLDVFGFGEHLSNFAALRTQVVDKHGADWAILGPHVADAVRRNYEPGRFVTVIGHEYTPDEKVLLGKGDYCVFSPSEEWADVPMAHEAPDLIDIAADHGAVVIPHVGGRTPKWPEVKVDPKVTPMVEIASMHGHFECFAQEALQLGHKLAFCGMSDGHFGAPGYDIWAQHGRTGGLKHRNYAVQSAITAFLVPEFTREAVFEAMRNRRVYATTGNRITVDFAVAGVGMGGEVCVGEAPTLSMTVRGTAPIATVDIIRGDRRVHRIKGEGNMDLALEWADPAPIKGETWYYIRVTQEDFSIAWASPVWVTSSVGDDCVDASLPKWDDGPFWPEKNPAACDLAHFDRLKAIFAKRDITDRFVDIEPVGVFQEPRGRFALFLAKDANHDCEPVHIHLFVDFEDDRLYIAQGTQDFGAGLY
jgi:Protein of unknown function (DUF3604)